MPTLLNWRGWTFFFYSADWHEPPHVHIRKGRQEVKFWLSDCSVAAIRRVSDRDINVLQRKVMAERDRFLERWDEHFRGRA